ncbi:putative 2-oxoglutarate-dependent dioxygenase At3g49630 [Arabidopsis thaliana] [Rhizoctonia solani]|uniref:Putative 2-oxoglutarate-dependent dioxygenase At3g49630 [Arabidopsis thaliana] n=1 Tax=Rhizoctonia solani TaxID=456999 RepID=A0A0K6FX62_9AGAM|nr:unnamed protein product [Rhizoctonia solani]CUA70744.1 putative 2-oxoglutarate-dependent dioxygenase At3g49630 [Arabidopsis thaliana] [Rhizoctonia solani]
MLDNFRPETALLNGEEVEIAPLVTINLHKLVEGDPTEAQRLLESCEKDGFFYLNLQGPHSSSKILDDQNALLDVMRNYFAQPKEVKEEDNIESMTDGFKPVGTFAGVKRNSRDCYETLRVAYKNVIERSELMPPTVKTHLPLFHDFVSNSQFITQMILTRLSDAMHLEGMARFENSHRSEQPSTTTLVLLHYPENYDNANSGHNKHTDIGSLTLLFTPQWGLQLLSPDKKSRSWLWVQPRPGHAVINVGDSLRFLSGKRFKSCLHRVFPTTDGYQTESRYSIAYFLRPESTAKFEDTEGRAVSAKTWHDEKYVVYTQPHHKQDLTTMLTGGMEQILSS